MARPTYDATDALVPMMSEVKRTVVEASSIEDMKQKLKAGHMVMIQSVPRTSYPTVERR